MIDLNEPRIEAISYLVRHNFDLVDDINETYRKVFGCMTVRFQVSPIYSLFKCTMSSSEDTSFCVEWIDLPALNILRELEAIVYNIPSFTEGKKLDEFVDKSQGTIYNKDL